METWVDKHLFWRELINYCYIDLVQSFIPRGGGGSPKCWWWHDFKIISIGIWKWAPPCPWKKKKFYLHLVTALFLVVAAYQTKTSWRETGSDATVVATSSVSDGPTIEFGLVRKMSLFAASRRHDHSAQPLRRYVFRFFRVYCPSASRVAF